MAQRMSSALGVDHKAIENAGAYDRFIDIDSLLYVDPHLLAVSAAPEMVAASDTLEEYWTDTVRVVRNIFEHGDRFWREAVSRFTFPEHPNAGLGYALSGGSGSAVGRQTAEGLVDTAQQLIRAGITDPKIFELVGIFEPGVGPDLISDITIRIIEPHLLEFTERVAGEAGLPVAAYSVDSTDYQLPTVDEADGYVLIFPRDILRDLPVAFSWDEVDLVCAHNDALRKRMNALIGDNWRRAVLDNTKERLKQALLGNPDALTDLVSQYKDKPGRAYDFSEDVLGETIWLEESQRAASHFPLALNKYSPVTPENILDVVHTICTHFRTLVEDNGLCYHFWTDAGKRRHERAAQLLFYGIADAYCRANGLDMSPETNSGRGPVDFKMSKGSSAKVLVEVKWSTNPRLVHGFEVQLKEYEKAERTSTSIFLVIQVADSTTSIDRVLELQSEAIRARRTTPEVRVVDGRKKDSASHYSPE